MTGYLDHVLARGRQAAPLLRPRPRSRFEQVALPFTPAPTRPGPTRRAPVDSATPGTTQRPDAPEPEAIEFRPPEPEPPDQEHRGVQEADPPHAADGAGGPVRPASLVDQPAAVDGVPHDIDINIHESAWSTPTDAPPTPDGLSPRRRRATGERRAVGTSTPVPLEHDVAITRQRSPARSGDGAPDAAGATEAAAVEGSSRPARPPRHVRTGRGAATALPEPPSPATTGPLASQASQPSPSQAAPPQTQHSAEPAHVDRSPSAPSTEQFDRDALEPPITASLRVRGVAAAPDPPSRTPTPPADPVPAQPPVVHVTIGRVEVRSPPSPPLPPSPPPASPPGPQPLSLDDYLRQRDGLLQPHGWGP